MSEMIEKSPSAEKLALIRRFLTASGTQAEIESGSFLQRFALPGGALSMAAATAPGGITYQQAFELPMNALLNAYAKHQATWQKEYEAHVNWEFTEEELSLIVDFLESPIGEHFLEGRWRIGAYIGTSTEDLIEQIIAEAAAALDSTFAPSPE